ncbi:hypothetical protein GCM10027517_17650 [Phycicoccus ginsengisoli]
MTTHHPRRTHDPRTAIHRPRIQALTSLWMLAVFAAWTVLFIAFTGPIAQLFGFETASGEMPYVEGWLGWTTMTLLWAAPLIAGVALAWHSLHRDPAQRPARVALSVNGVLLVALVVPSLLDRILHLR